MSSPQASKVDLAKYVSDSAVCDPKEGLVVVEAVLAGIAELSVGKKLIIRGFGTFEVKHKAARTARNPQTGLPVEVPARSELTFKAAKAKA